VQRSNSESQRLGRSIDVDRTKSCGKAVAEREALVCVRKSFWA
jgi:hypothetical protein